MGHLDGKVAVVTGAGRLRGIGRAAAVALAQHGADVVVTGTGRDPATFPNDEKQMGWHDITSTAEQVRAEGVRCLEVVCDVTIAREVNHVVDQAMEQFGRIDVLVDIAHSLGLDLTESKAVLDVDRYEADLARIHRQATEAGVTSAPGLVAPTGTLQGFHNQAAIGTLLDGR